MEDFSNDEEFDVDFKVLKIKLLRSAPVSLPVGSLQSENDSRTEQQPEK
jgi:hypothetical protein